jgi:prepilin-type N-terminal cleavage/methylation domain-containing protein
MTMKKFKGMSLIEVLIVIALVGTLAGFAYPAYRKYIVKTEVSKLYSNAVGLQAIISDEVIEDQKSNFTGISFDADNASVKDGVITVTSDQVVDGKNVVFIMTPDFDDSVISWTCSTTTEDFFPYLPKNCHKAPLSEEDEGATEDNEDSDNSGGKGNGNNNNGIGDVVDTVDDVVNTDGDGDNSITIHNPNKRGGGFRRGGVPSLNDPRGGFR